MAIILSRINDGVEKTVNCSSQTLLLCNAKKWAILSCGIMVFPMLELVMALSLVGRKSKEAMRKAYLYARADLESGKPETMANVGSASVMVINGEKIVMAQIGGYRAIVCRDGVAHQLRAIRIPKVHIQACHLGSESSRKQTNSSELIATTERVDSETEFIILASIGVFEVMRNQEAVDLIRHIDDPQEAAKCLAREALTRISRSNISCIVIRFD
ncbi:putative protein phosphatase 2C-like protein 44 [Bienertia sinuspersici]